MLKHVALEVMDQEKTALFFTEILGLARVKASTLTKELGSALFGRDEPVDMEIWANEEMCIEAFVTDTPAPFTYCHICIEVPDMGAFVERCKANGVTLITAQKGDRELLFIRDFSGNLYEIH